VHKDYWVAISIYVVAVVLTALPFFGIVTIKLDLDCGTLKFLHVCFVFVAISILVGQLIAYNVMQHAKITTPEALKYLSLLDHGVPVLLGGAFSLSSLWRTQSFGGGACQVSDALAYGSEQSACRVVGLAYEAAQSIGHGLPAHLTMC